MIFAKIWRNLAIPWKTKIVDLKLSPTAGIEQNTTASSPKFLRSKKRGNKSTIHAIKEPEVTWKAVQWYNQALFMINSQAGKNPIPLSNDVKNINRMSVHNFSIRK